MLLTEQRLPKGIGGTQEVWKDSFVTRRHTPKKAKEHTRRMCFGLTGRWHICRGSGPIRLLLFPAGLTTACCICSCTHLTLPPRNKLLEDRNHADGCLTPCSSCLTSCWCSANEEEHKEEMIKSSRISLQKCPVGLTGWSHTAAILLWHPCKILFFFF